jgi:hypothetical protein
MALTGFVVSCAIAVKQIQENNNSPRKLLFFILILF